MKPSTQLRFGRLRFWKFALAASMSLNVLLAFLLLEMRAPRAPEDARPAAKGKLAKNGPKFSMGQVSPEVAGSGATSDDEEDRSLSRKPAAPENLPTTP